ncbi:MAG: hypothetical protein GYB37_05525 [Algicola sp.]|nr:hypothetical protein [Algicola sp.]
MRRIIFLLSILYCSVSMSQNSKVNIDFNILDSNFSTKKYLDNDGCAHFYIEKEHFKANDSPEIINLKKLNSINLIDLDKFIDISDSKRKNLIKKGEKDGMIKLLSNEEVFDTIYLYEKAKDNKVLKYRVIWVDEIID